MNPIKRALVHELAAKELQSYIIDHNLNEGDKLPSMDVLCNLMQVGRSSMREALRYLEALDIIDIINGKGIFVKDINSYRLSAKVRVESFKQMLLHVSEVRRALEGLAVELSCSRASKENIAEIEHHLAELERLHNLKQDKSQTDMRFHQSIYKAAGNPVLESLIGSMWEMMEHFWQYPFGQESIFDDTYPYHFTLGEAIKNKDVDKAREEFGKIMDGVVTDIINAPEH